MGVQRWLFAHSEFKSINFLFTALVFVKAIGSDKKFSYSVDAISCQYFFGLVSSAYHAIHNVGSVRAIPRNLPARLPIDA